MVAGIGCGSFLSMVVLDAPAKSPMKRYWRLACEGLILCVSVDGQEVGSFHHWSSRISPIADVHERFVDDMPVLGSTFKSVASTYGSDVFLRPVRLKEYTALMQMVGMSG
jgi:hypothetical protein